MNIEIANRLLSCRKEAGLSQEELAAKLGISRQAVSRWERAEASPDTDNLIALAKLYGVSLDDLLMNNEEGAAESAADGADEEDSPTGDGESQPGETEETDADNSDGEDHVSFSGGGIHVYDKDGTEVHVGIKGVYVNDSKTGERVEIGHGKSYVKSYAAGRKTGRAYKFFMLFPFPVVALAAFLLWGFLVDGGWSVSWLAFFSVPLYYSFVDAVAKRNANHFAYPVLVTGLYLASGMLLGNWHPEWVIFITVPVYYSIVTAIRKARGKEN